MKQVGLAVLMLAAVAVPASGASYDDLNAGLSYFELKQYDNAIIWFDKALAAGDLIPDQARIAYIDRGITYGIKQDISHALADFTAAIAVDPNNAMAYRHRVAIYLASGEFEKAAADYDKLHSLRPFDYDVAFEDGLLNWQLNHIETSASAFGAISAVSPYSWSWLQLANIRLGKPMTEFKETDDNKNWPGPIPRFFQGHASESDVLKAAEQGGNKRNLCVAQLLTGMWREVHGDREGAMPLLKAAADNCPNDSPNGRFVHSELEKITTAENSK
jgi:tetratricopeptide (TPR) repeat protein